MISLNQSDQLLVISCAGEQTGGGLLVYDGQHLEVIDRLSTAGLRVVDQHLHRLLLSPDGPETSGEFLIYDQRGVERYYRLDAAGDAHDVAWDGSNFVLVSSATNTVLWASPTGEITRAWTAPGEGDCWHLNCIALKDDDLYVSGFGKYGYHRAWVDHLGQPDGFLMQISTGQDVLQGLICPHSPRWFDGGWAICNSAVSDIVQFDANNREVVRRAQLQGWTRGMAVADGLLLVGESAKRHDTSGETGSIAIVERKTWDVLDRVSIPYSEIGELVLVSASLLQGLRVGFRTNPLRQAEQDQHALFRRVGVEPRLMWAVSDPLLETECHIRVDVKVPTELRAGEQLIIPCRVTNLGSRFLVSAPPFPVSIASKWIADHGQTTRPFIESERSRLPRSLPPGESETIEVKLAVPDEKGAFQLRVTMVQDGVRWFDDANIENASVHLVHIVSGSVIARGDMGSKDVVSAPESAG